MPDKIRNQFLLPLACLSLFLLYSCESQKSDVTNAPGTAANAPSQASPDVSGGESSQQTTGAAVKESTQRRPEGTPKSPPVITTAQLVPGVVDNIDSLIVIAEGSGGEGEVTFKYEWTKNGEPAGDNNALAGLKRGDKISVRITPYDGKAYGPPRTLTAEIHNANPKILEHKDLISTGKVFSYQVRATDPDGDTLSYSLKSAPKGMTIDPATGLIKWQVPEDFEGKAPVTVSVTDGRGGEVFQSFTVDAKIERRRQ